MSRAACTAQVLEGTNGFAYTDLWELTELKIGIEESQDAAGSVVTPNPCPAGGKLRVDLPYSSSAQLTMFNAQGQLVYGQALGYGQKIITVPVLLEGLYIGVLIKDALITERFNLAIVN